MWKTLVLIAAVLLVMASPLLAQTEPVVYAVLLYSPTCPHCHDVINNHLPGIAERFGSQLQLILVDVTTQGGGALAQSAYTYYAILRDHWVVPMLLVGDQVLIGGVQIPEELPGIVEIGLASGGIELPDFPGMRESYSQYMDEQASVATPSEVVEPAAANSATDVLANALATFILGALALSLLAVLRPLSERLVRGAQGAALI